MGHMTGRRWGGKKAGVDVVFARYECKRVANLSTTSMTTWREKEGNHELLSTRSARANRAAHSFSCLFALAAVSLSYCMIIDDTLLDYITISHVAHPRTFSVLDAHLGGDNSASFLL